MSKTWIFFFSLFIFKILTFSLPFKSNNKPSMLISCTFMFLVKFEGNCFIVISIKFIILVESNYNCSMFICCIFASLVISNFNFSMVNSFALHLWLGLFTIFPWLFLTLVYCHLFYLKKIWTKVESLKNIKMLSYLFFYFTDGMLKKWYITMKNFGLY